MTKDELKKIIDDPRDKLICVDLDHTLCEGEFWGGDDPKPIQDMIDTVAAWYTAGAHIIIYTARVPEYYQITHAWLIKHGVPYHGIAMRTKPGADVYVDDKALHIDDIS